MNRSDAMTMKSLFRLTTLNLILTTLLFGSFESAQAQLPPSVPAEFTNLYALMQTDLTNFEATVDANWKGTYYTNCKFAAVIEPATDGGEGAAVSNVYYFKDGVLPFINALQGMGVKAVKFSINFPLLYQPYYTSTNGLSYPAGYTNMINFASNVVSAVRERGMYLIMPTQNVFPFLLPSISGYYSSLSFSDYTNGRSAQIQTIAKMFEPDVLMMQSEPITEVDNLTTNLSGRLDDPVVDTNMLAGFLNDLGRAGLRRTNTLIGAGMGTWQPSFDTYLTNFVNLPLDILDVHVYPINRTTNDTVVTDFLQRTLQMAEAAHAKGMKVGLGEFWMQKEYDTELANPPSQLVFEGRNTYSFWSPLDREMLLCMVKLAHYQQYEFIDPFFTEYFFAYLNYTNEQPRIAGLAGAAAGTKLNSDEDAALSLALAAGGVTSTGQAYEEYASTASPVLDPSPRNSGYLTFSWTAVASEYQLEQSTNLTLGSWTVPHAAPRAVGADYTNSFGLTNKEAFYRLYLP